MAEKKLEKPTSIGPYEIIRMIGKGGMGEVYLVKDPICSRAVALKRIKPELKEKKNIKERFLKEAKLTSKLTHPSIISILNIHSSKEDVYYTMPFAEGETLRKILHTTKEQEKLGRPLHPIGKSVPALTRIFLQICQAIAYTHTRGIIHRDLKPENVIVGKYGEVTLIDWGLASYIEEEKKKKETEKQIEKEAIEKGADKEEQKGGKVAGTLTYMAPELIKGAPNSVKTDIYALGVILYQLLSLKMPLQRKTVGAFRKNVDREEIPDLFEMSPNREIPHQLASVALKCLSKRQVDRYKDVGELIADVKKYIEGRPEWIPMASMRLEEKKDWLLEENILLPKHIAISKTLDSTTWAALKISRKTFVDNVRIDATVCLEADSQGVGILFSIPEAEERRGIEEGYCIWLGSKSNPSHRLFRNNVQVLEAKRIFLEPKKKYAIRIEKIEDQIKLYIDDLLKLSFTSYLPLSGSHVGFLNKDGNFSVLEFNVLSGSLNAMVNCLAVPNAFWNHRLYDIAYQEYRRIAQSFKGRTEGREALFRAGLTLLEQGKAKDDPDLFHAALEEFEQLFKTPGAPLEYLGKSLVYEAMNDPEEEAKCLELALRKFPKHPLLPMIQEHVIYRMHESSIKTREAAYRLILLAIRQIPNLMSLTDADALIESLQYNWENLPFIEDDPDELTLVAIQLCFWLKKVPTLVEIGKEIIKKEPYNTVLLGNILFCLIELEAQEEIASFPIIESINRMFFSLKQEPSKDWGVKELRVFYYLIRNGLEERNFEELEICFKNLAQVKMSKQERTLFDSYEIWFHLLQKEPKKAEDIFRKYPSTQLTQESNPLHFAFGAWLYLVKGPKMAKVHFGSVLDTPFPSTPALPSHFLAGKINEKKGWITEAFFWEKKELYRQLELFYAVIKKEPKQKK